ncbi:DUF1549 domain-containing protein [Phragmitibacter flavus]|uniref:DUF1549 domain-containing protein n=1 Tax=Phragmitibacter flavus TaxID=2576071 RepID=A0A5R8KG34_9BACT|nr:DUF1549 domain-containing protein [Phragmitibacter flavus]TLD70915.1 DUF1549 domain-containing protein [Phragmitibacter flavus]
MRFPPPITLITLLLLAATPTLLPAAPDFAKDIAPILEQRCLSCHDEHSAKGDIRLHQAPPASLHATLLDQISGPNPAMPKKGDPLTPDQVGLIRQWINAGAPWPDHLTLKDNPTRDLNWWSLNPLSDTPIPFDQHPVDHFINIQLANLNLTPVPDAEPITLIRRLSYDITGLPPTPQQVDTFIQLSQKAGLARAIETTVDQLLASPAFGEKWAQHWLDLARYADTHGYDKDKPRPNAWPYRDYIINSLNHDKPYPRFVTEQIAGDALHPTEPDPDSIAALGFLAAGPWDHIAHTEVGENKIDGRIGKHMDRDEMIAATYNVFLATTVQCAQCHHHKADPIRTEDYYRLHAIFAAVDRADRIYAGPTPDQQKTLHNLQSQITQYQTELDQINRSIQTPLTERTQTIQTRITQLRQQYGIPPKPSFGWHSAITKNPHDIKWVQVDLGSLQPIHQIRIQPAFDNYNNIGPGFGFPKRFKVETSTNPHFKTDVTVLLDHTQADFENPKDSPILINHHLAATRYLRITATHLATRQNDHIFALGEIEIYNHTDPQKNIALGTTVTALDSIESPPRWSRNNLTDGILHQELNNPTALAELRQLEQQHQTIHNELRTPEKAQRIAQLETTLTGLNQKLQTLPPGQSVYAVTTQFKPQGQFKPTSGKPRPIHLLHRGDINAPGDLMLPGMPPLWPGAQPEFTLPPDTPESTARLQLAQSITSTDNPIFWRTIANRLWLWTFSQPLVSTPNDFGRMGLQPSHPALLDHLAIRLRNDPQHSLKNIIRLLFTSQAYRRSSTHHPHNATIDATNTHLWRANRRRLTAEEFRDTLLTTTDLIQLDQRHGPGFQDFVIDKPQHSPHYQYDQHDPENPLAHRRSIYRMIVRSQPQPLLTVLDCADPSLSIPMRDESTTALQALAQWNNRFVETMSRHLATRLTNEAPTPHEKIHLATQLTLGRPPDPHELTALTDHLDQHGPASLARVLYNLNAFIYVD